MPKNCHHPRMRVTQVTFGVAHEDSACACGAQAISPGWPAFAGHDSFYFENRVWVSPRAIAANIVRNFARALMPVQLSYSTRTR